MSTAVLVFDRALHLSYLNPAVRMLLEISADRPRHTGRGRDAGTRRTRRAAACSTRGLEPFTERELDLHAAYGQRMIVDCTVTPYGTGELLLEIIRVDRHLRIAQEEILLAQQHRGA